MTSSLIAVVIPCYKVRNHILQVINTIGPEVDRIYVVDDACPVGSGNLVETDCKDPRVRLLRHTKNQGVGGALITGFQQALADKYDIVIKIDGDGQMDPRLIPHFIDPILHHQADFTKGNRFFDPESLIQMPTIRLFGNAVLSFISKCSSGYWDIMDPTNGYLAIHRTALERVPLRKLSKRYFFESDLLFRLGTIRAVVRDIPMTAHYADEESNLRISKVIREFPKLYLNRFIKRLAYTYFVRDFNWGSCSLLLGSIISGIGVFYTASKWIESALQAYHQPTGTVVLASLLLMIGFQLLLSFIQFDVSNIPRVPLQRKSIPLTPKT